MTPSGTEAITRLKDGNHRFTNSGQGGEPPGIPLYSFSDLSEGQQPLAAILACSDSRVPVETIFSQRAGSLFVVRVAGNVAGPHQLGSLEFAVAELGVPLVLVMGHTGCGAVDAALSAARDGLPGGHGQQGHLPALLEPIITVLDRSSGSQLRGGTLDPEEAVRLNVIGTCGELTQRSELMASRVESGGLMVMGSVYDLRTGRVDVFHSGPDLPSP